MDLRGFGSKQFGVRVTEQCAPTGGRFTPRLETLSGYLAEMPSPYWVNSCPL